MDRYKNSIQIGYQCKNPFVCCLFVYLHFRQSLISVAVCGFKYRLERGKVFGVNTLWRRKIQPETACRPTFQLSNEVCTSFADEQRKWVIGGIGELIISQIDDRLNSNNCTYTMKSSPPFCPFIKKLYLCTSRVITLVQDNNELWNRNGCHRVTQFPCNPNNRLILR